jgi:uncharacterized protein YkvS
MITDKDLEFVYAGVRGDALSWVIDEDVVYDMALTIEHADMFLAVTEAVDISADHPDHDGIVVRLMKDEEVLGDLATSEYFGSILLSSPTVVNAKNHKNGMHVIAPNAKFVDYEFVITNQDPTHLMGWRSDDEPTDGKIANCYSRCNCGWISS